MFRELFIIDKIKRSNINVYAQMNSKNVADVCNGILCSLKTKEIMAHAMT